MQPWGAPPPAGRSVRSPPPGALCAGAAVAGAVGSGNAAVGRPEGPTDNVRALPHRWKTRTSTSRAGPCVSSRPQDSAALVTAWESASVATFARLPVGVCADGADVASPAEEATVPRPATKPTATATPTSTIAAAPPPISSPRLRESDRALPAPALGSGGSWSSGSSTMGWGRVAGLATADGASGGDDGGDGGGAAGASSGATEAVFSASGAGHSTSGWFAWSQ